MQQECDKRDDVYSALTRREGDVLNPQCIGGYKINYNIGHKWPILFYPVLRHGWGRNFICAAKVQKKSHIRKRTRDFFADECHYVAVFEMTIWQYGNFKDAHNLL